MAHIHTFLPHTHSLLVIMTGRAREELTLGLLFSHIRLLPPLFSAQLTSPPPGEGLASLSSPAGCIFSNAIVSLAFADPPRSYTFLFSSQNDLCPSHTLSPPPLFAGTFKLLIEFSEEYPNKPPTVRFVSRMFHPNGKWYSCPNKHMVTDSWSLI